jgi:hypothetical protein
MFKRNADEVARIMAELIAQKDAVWNQLTLTSAKLARAEDRYSALERERDEWRNRARDYQARWEGKS